MTKVLITGAAGFWGSFVLGELVEHKEYTVTAAFHPDETPVKRLKSINYVAIDLTNREKTEVLVKKFDYVIHLAALVQGSGRYSDAPATVMAENLTIDINVIRAAAAAKVKRLVYTSSHEILRAINDSPKPVSEKVLDTPMAYPENAYAFTKLVGERLCKAFIQEYGLDCVIVYGLSYDYGVLITPESSRGYLPRVVGGITKKKQDESGWIPLFVEIIQKILSGKKPLIFSGHPKRKRYWTDLRDTARGIVLALESKKASGQSIFLASSEMFTYEEFVKAIFQKIRPGEKLEAKFVKSGRLPSLFHVPDTKKANKLLGWKAKYKLDESLDEIITWVKDEFPQK